MGRFLCLGTLGFLTMAALITTAAPADDEVPADFARFEGLVGGWKGTAQPAANRLKGWQEAHAWAWKFAKGKPIGMSLTITGGKVFTKGDLGYDPARKQFTLAATDPAGKAIRYAGVPTADGKGLVLDREEATPEGKERVTIRPNASGIRYTMLVDRKAAGSPQYKNAISVGLTKDGESFAAGGGAADLPKCIITGGAATMTVSHDGKTYPICCSGCRDEFNDAPDKYLARLAAREKGESDKASAKKPAPKPAPSRSTGEFDGLLEDTTKPKKPGA